MWGTESGFRLGMDDYGRFDAWVLFFMGGMLFYLLVFDAIVNYGGGRRRWEARKRFILTIE